MNQNKKWKVLISAPYFQPVVDRFMPVFTENEIEVVVPKVNERLSEEELLKYVGDIDGAICGDDRFTDKVMALSPRLKVISKWGTGIDSIDQKAAALRGIAVRNTPNAFTDPVADTTLGFILNFARQITWSDQEVKKGNWEKIPSVSLREWTIGIIGVGNIGQAVARRLKAFGARVLGNDIKTISEDIINKLGIEMTNLDQLLIESDIIILHCDLNPTSHHIINEAQIAKMKPAVHIINTARGPLIDEVALVNALQAGKIAGAALDVFENEPLPPDSPLRSFPRVILASHNANSSPAAWERVHQNTVKNLLEELKNRG
ncbi:MAG: phosphoglycerate dehydrogenase [bacterium]|nr:phosphoglycerate dehydrogenase [bacterium]